MGHDFRQPGGGRTIALAPTTLTVRAGEAVALVGPSGSGKTTLLSIIAGLLLPTTGEVEVAGVALGGLGEAARDRFRARHIGFVFQAFNLLPAFTARENVELALTLAGALPRPERRARAEALLRELGLGHRLNHRPAQLSAGEQQRVGVARALANRPSVLLADEPTANVDPDTRDTVLATLLAATRAAGGALLVATHDHSLLGRFDHVCCLTAPGAHAATAAVARG